MGWHQGPTANRNGEVRGLPTGQARWGLIYTGVVSHHEADRQLTVLGHAHGAQLTALWRQIPFPGSPQPTVLSDSNLFGSQAAHEPNLFLVLLFEN